MNIQEVGWGHGLDQSGSGQREVADTCECSNEPSGSIKCGEFLDQLRTGQFLKKDSALWSKLSMVFLKKAVGPKRVAAFKQIFYVLLYKGHIFGYGV